MHGVRGLKNSVLFQFSANLFVDSAQFPLKYQQAFFFVDIDKLIVKFMWKHRGSEIANTVLKTKNRIGGFIFTDLKSFCKTAIIRRMGYWFKGI